MGMNDFMQKEMEQITFDQSNNQLLYFTSTSILGDNESLIFISDRTGNPNLFFMDLESKMERQLTFYHDGILQSYVYFNGSPYCGFGKASVSVDAKRGLIYYLHGRDICVVNTMGEQRILNQLPMEQMTGFTHVSENGKYLCVPTVDAAAFDIEEEWGTAIDRKIINENLSSYLRVYKTDTGELVFCEEVKRAWVTHVQFCPTNERKILYNHEWTCEESGIRRMWLFDGHQHIRLRTCDENRYIEDWACHEMWEKNGEWVIYHGAYGKGKHEGSCFIGRINVNDYSYIEIPIKKEYKTYGHFTVGDSGMLVSDGYYGNAPEDYGNWAGTWISLQQVDWENKSIKWIPLLRHESSFDCQCSHPHPIFDHGDQFVYFTSDRRGKRQIYRTKVTCEGKERI